MTEVDQTSTREIRGKLEEIRLQLSRTHHDINNPLSVISGNVALLGELASAIGAKGEFEGPLEDIEKAIDILTENVDRLIVVRKILSDLSEQISDL